MDTVVLGINRKAQLGVGGLDKRYRPMDQIQINVICPQVLESQIEGLFNVGSFVVCVPKLRCQENLSSGYTRSFNTSADFFFVIIDRCRIDVTVAVLEGVFDCASYLVGRRLLDTVVSNVLLVWVARTWHDRMRSREGRTQVPSPTAGMEKPELSLKDRPEDMMTLNLAEEGGRMDEETQAGNFA